jgi:hypothetical protein
MNKKNFFISYTASDEKWATWIAGTLEENGYTTCLQAWDFKAGENFVLNMHEALENCDKFIAVLSAEYMEKVYCQAEWTAAFTKDPSSKKGLFIPIISYLGEYCMRFLEMPYIDIFGVDGKEAEERLKQITGKGKRRIKSEFPGGHH